MGWHGGDLADVRQKLEEGYFQRMGFTAIWISPVVLQVPPPGSGGGVQGLVADGTLVEVTGATHALSVSGGRLRGRMPALTAFGLKAP